MHVQDVYGPSASTGGVTDAVSRADSAGGEATGPVPDPVPKERAPAKRVAALRVDAQRNLEHVVRAAREVFGESGYGAPMEDVARRARVGVGTVYRRFQSKEALVERIAEEETARLTEQARGALAQEEDPWAALSRFLRTAVASGSGRLLPPPLLRVGVSPEAPGSPGVAGRATESVGGDTSSSYVPRQRQDRADADQTEGAGNPAEGDSESPETAAPQVAVLLDVVGQLVDRARAAGELRKDVTVSDVLLVMATSAPSLPDADQRRAASARLLDILLDGLRARTAD